MYEQASAPVASDGKVILKEEARLIDAATESKRLKIIHDMGRMRKSADHHWQKPCLPCWGKILVKLRVLLVYQIRTRLFPWACSFKNFQQFSESIDTIY